MMEMRWEEERAQRKNPTLALMRQRREQKWREAELRERRRHQMWTTAFCGFLFFIGAFCPDWLPVEWDGRDRLAVFVILAAPLLFQAGVLLGYVQGKEDA